MKRMLCLLTVLLLLSGCSGPAGTASTSDPPEYDRVVIVMLDTGISTAAIHSG